MMRGQLSLEFLAYLSIAGISLLFTGAIFHSGTAKISALNANYQEQQFVAVINSAMLTGQNYIQLKVFLPRGICGSHGAGMNFAVPIIIGGGAVCPDNIEAAVSLSLNGTTYYLSKV